MTDKTTEIEASDGREASECSALLYSALEDLESWLDHECALCGAVDGYDYNSGFEYGLRKAALEVQKRKRAI